MTQPASTSASIPRSISNEEIASLPIRRYEGLVVQVETREQLVAAAADIVRERVVGMDTETRPAFRVGESYPPCLAQIATARAVDLFPLQRMDCSGVLAGMLGDPRVVKIGIGLADDLHKLKQVFEFEQASVLDAGAVVKRHGVEQTGLRNLAAMFLGFRIAKGKRTSNWAARNLTEAQIAYAATDAWAPRELFLRYQELGLLG